MSFASKVKEEISSIPLEDDYAMRAELAGSILFSNHNLKEGRQKDHIEFHTELETVARRLSLLIYNLCDVDPEMSLNVREGGNAGSYTIAVHDMASVVKVLRSARIINDLGTLDEECLILDNPLLQMQDNKRAFLRGVFLVAGSITDPNKDYHFEICCSSQSYVYQLQELLESFGLMAHIVIRKKYYILYFKEGSMISDMLNIMGAHISMMEFENIRIVKDVRNSVNRRVNCETANLNKAVNAGRRQAQDIEFIKNTIGLEKLPQSLRDVAYARLEEPDLSLKELGEMLEPPVGKSGVNHRLRKLSQMAQKLKEQKYL